MITSLIFEKNPQYPNPTTHPSIHPSIDTTFPNLPTNIQTPLTIQIPTNPLSSLVKKKLILTHSLFPPTLLLRDLLTSLTSREPAQSRSNSRRYVKRIEGPEQIKTNLVNRGNYYYSV